VYFVVTASTQPLLWTSLNFSLTNGISLLGSPTIYTTPNTAPEYQIDSTISLFDALRHSEEDRRPKLQKQVTCAVQAQVLQAMATGLTETAAEQAVYRTKALTYQRDLQYFYENDRDAMASLIALACGTPTVPGLHATFGVVHVPHWTERRQQLYYLKDWELAAVLVNLHNRGGDINAECILLWPLIPIARNGETDHSEIPDNHFNDITFGNGNWERFWSFVLEHLVNQTAAATNPQPTWNSLFRLARNIYCHSDTNSVVALYGEFVNYFGTIRAVQSVLSKALDFYQ